MNNLTSSEPEEVSWIGEIPDGWEIKRFKHIFSEKKSTRNPLLSSGSISFGEVIFKDDESIPETTKESYQEVLEGEFLINPLNLNYDLKSLRIGLSRINVVVSQGYIVLKINEGFHSQFYKYLLRKFDVEHMKSLGQGVRQTISFTHIKDEKLVSPPITEQELISQYLDKKTEQIDRLVEKIQKKIDLLKEQRTSLINHYVTKGLDPNVEMKDSGVEWIGEIPSHWELIRLKYLVSLEGGKDPKSVETDYGQYPIFGTGGEISRSSDFIYDKPTLLLGRKGTIDRPFVVNEPFWVSDVMYYTVQISEIYPEYLLKLFNLVPFGYYRYGSTQPSMSRLDYENMLFPIPGKDERISISNFLDAKLLNIETLIEKQNRKVSLYKEYRQSLISSAVTGKIRITEEMI